MLLQPTFGSFGDFVTLIQITLEVKKLIQDGVMMRRDVRKFTLFLDHYCRTMYCIHCHLNSQLSYVPPCEDLNCINDAAEESTRLVHNFKIYMNSFRSDSWWGQIIVQRVRWALVGKAELVALKEGLISQRDTIHFTLSVANL